MAQHPFYSDREGLFFKVLENDSTLENLRPLIHFRNVISRQLPNMPRDYITRMVASNHTNIIAFKARDRESGEKVTPFPLTPPNRSTS